MRPGARFGVALGGSLLAHLVVLGLVSRWERRPRQRETVGIELIELTGNAAATGQATAPEAVAGAAAVEGAGGRARAPTRRALATGSTDGANPEASTDHAHPSPPRSRRTNTRAAQTESPSHATEAGSPDARRDLSSISARSSALLSPDATKNEAEIETASRTQRPPLVVAQREPIAAATRGASTPAPLPASRREGAGESAPKSPTGAISSGASTGGSTGGGDSSRGGAPATAAAAEATAAASAPAGLIAELHRRLAQSAHACYPATARRFRLRGEVGLHFCLDGSGGSSGVRLEGSTGSQLLDQAASGCVLQGARPPEGLRGCFDLPVRFGD